MKLSTTIERDFVKVGENLYLEVIRHVIVVTAPDGEVTRKLDKELKGNLFKEDNEKNSASGVYVHVFPDGQSRRLIAVSN